jgi:hypothetical protein
MLSKRMTEKRREATAVAAIKTRMINRNRPLVLRPVSPLKKELPTLAAMIELGCGIGLTAVALWRGRHKFTSGHLSFTTQTTTRTGLLACASMSRDPDPRPSLRQSPLYLRFTLSAVKHNYSARTSCSSSNTERILRLWNICTHQCTNTHKKPQSIHQPKSLVPPPNAKLSCEYAKLQSDMSSHPPSVLLCLPLLPSSPSTATGNPYGYFSTTFGTRVFATLKGLISAASLGISSR